MKKLFFLSIILIIAFAMFGQDVTIGTSTVVTGTSQVANDSSIVTTIFDKIWYILSLLVGSVGVFIINMILKFAKNKKVLLILETGAVVTDKVGDLMHIMSTILKKCADGEITSTDAKDIQDSINKANAANIDNDATTMKKEVQNAVNAYKKLERKG